MSINSISFTNILKELRKIKYVNTKDGRKLLSPITKKQRDIMNTCGISTDDLQAWLTKLSV